MSIGEVKDIVDRERVNYYLDGPEGFEWIYRNAILQRREEIMYVDLVEEDSKLRWQTPDFWIEEAKLIKECRPAICNLLIKTTESGLLTAHALKVLRQVWSKISLTPVTPWNECYQANIRFMQQVIKNDDIDIPEHVAAMVLNEFLFPLTGLNLSEEKIEHKSLEEKRNEAIRSWLRREFYD